MLVTCRFNKKGFTLMEMLVVIGIITILISIGIVSYGKVTEKAKVTADNANLSILNRATQYCANLKGKLTTELFPSATTGEEKMDFLIAEKTLGGRLEPQQNGVEFIFNDMDGIWYLSNDISGASSAGVLYKSDFEDDSGITLLRGNWGISDGYLFNTEDGEN